MPTKTVYVSDDDVELYQRAQELAGGNLSSAISRALRRYVEIADAAVEDFDDVELPVGRGGVYHRKRFVGRTVGAWRRTLGDTGEYMTAYLTRRGRYAVHSKRYPSAVEAGGAADDPRNTIEYWEQVTHFDDWGAVEYDLAVYERLSDLQQAVPPEFARIVEANSQRPPVEELDI
ncbi:EXLDI protein [Actinomadura sp. DSM 109109]|nr:EXLDI protein [Actinomadura lepetitiana]